MLSLSSNGRYQRQTYQMMPCNNFTTWTSYKYNVVIQYVRGNKSISLGLRIMDCDASGDEHSIVTWFPNIDHTQSCFFGAVSCPTIGESSTFQCGEEEMESNYIQTIQGKPTFSKISHSSLCQVSSIEIEVSTKII